MLDYALIHSLVATAYQNDAVLSRILFGSLLIEQASLRRKQRDARVRLLVRQRFHSAKQRLGLHHHPGAAAEGSIIHLAMPIVRVVAQVVDVNLDQPCLDCAANYSK